MPSVDFTKRGLNRNELIEKAKACREPMVLGDDILEGGFSPEDLEAFFVAIPPEVHTLNLGNHGLKLLLNSNKTLLSKLPSHITHLVFPLIQVSDPLSTKENLSEVFKNIPKHVKHIDLKVDTTSGTRPYTSYADCIKIIGEGIFQPLSAGLELSLKLSCNYKNNWNDYHVRFFQSILSYLPALNLYLDLTEQSVSDGTDYLTGGDRVFWYNWQGEKSLVDSDLFGTFQTNFTLKSLFCSGRTLCRFIAPEQVKFIEGIPSTVTTLALTEEKGYSAGSFGTEYKVPSQHLIDKLAAIGPNVKTLYLNWISFYGPRGCNDPDRLATIPKEMLLIVEALPLTITRLDFSYNLTYGFKKDKLKQIFARMPGALEEIDLNGNTDLTNLNASDLKEVLEQLSPHTQIVGIRDLRHAPLPAERISAPTQNSRLFSGVTIEHKKFYTERSAKEFCRKLLQNYVGEGELFFMHWRHHVSLIREVLQTFDETYTTAQQFNIHIRAKIREKNQSINEKGLLATILRETIIIEANTAPQPSSELSLTLR